MMKLHFRELPNDSGNNPVIILHGLFGSSDNWLTLGKRMAERFPVYLVDQRNHGRSEQSNDVFTYELMAEDLRGFIATHQLKNPILIGHSMGGKAAMQFALRYPDMYSKLIVVDIAPKPYKVHHSKILEGLNAIDLKNLTGREDADLILSGYEPDPATRQFLLKNLYRTDEGRFDWRLNLKVLSRDISHVVDTLKYDRPNYKPTLFIKGEKSDYVLENDIPMIKNIFRNAEIVEIAGAGHWVQADKPDAFLREVLNFMERREEAPAPQA